MAESQDQDQRTKALTRLNEMELSPTNPTIRAVAKRLRFKPETLVERTQKAFPSVFEQRIYVITSRIWKRVAHPETIAACFRYFNSGQDLCITDFRENGRGNTVLENTAQTLLLMSRGFVSKDVAMRFVERFGDRAEEVYNIIGDNLQMLMRKLGMGHSSSQAMMAILYAIAYADEEQGALNLDIVTTDDIAMVLGYVAEWPDLDDDEADRIIDAVSQDASEEGDEE